MNYQKLILENVQDYVFVLDGDVIVFATPSVSKFGYEVIGKKIYEFVDSKEKVKISEALKSLKDELEIRVLSKRKDRKRVWVDAKAKKVGNYVIVVGRDVSRLVSLETLLKAALDLLRFMPREVDELEKTLRKYFDDARFSEEIQEFEFKAGEVVVPVKFQDRILGTLKIYLPDWFEVKNEDLELFNIIGECMAKNILMLESRKIVKNSLIVLKEASADLALLIDRIRNPLMAINGLIEVKVGGEVYEKVHKQVKAIEEIVRTLDEEWDKIEKLADEIIETFALLERLKASDVR